MGLLTQDKLKEILRYNPDTGVFQWADPARSDRPVGHIHHGYLKISIPGFGGVYAHRLAWLYMTGSMPSKFMDHIDCNRRNNAWNNLRLATPSQNQANRRRTLRNVAGAKGVVPYRGGYRAAICVDGRHIFLGHYNSLEEAAAAYDGASKVAFGEFARAA